MCRERVQQCKSQHDTKKRMHTSSRCLPCLAGFVVLGRQPHLRLLPVLQLGLPLLASLSFFPALDCSPASAEQSCPANAKRHHPCTCNHHFVAINCSSFQWWSWQERACFKITWAIHD